MQSEPKRRREMPRGGRKPTARQLEAAARWIAQAEDTAKRHLTYGERVQRLGQAFDWTQGTIERVALIGLDVERQGADSRKPREA